MAHRITRRRFLLSPGAFSVAAVARAAPSKPTNFQIACMTLPYAQFPLLRALEGIARAGFRFVVWGSTHAESPGVRTPTLALDAPPAEAKRLAARCRDNSLRLIGPASLLPSSDTAPSCWLRVVPKSKKRLYVFAFDPAGGSLCQHRKSSKPIPVSYSCLCAKRVVRCTG